MRVLHLVAFLAVLVTAVVAYVCLLHLRGAIKADTRPVHYRWTKVCAYSEGQGSRGSRDCACRRTMRYSTSSVQ